MEGSAIAALEHILSEYPAWIGAVLFAVVFVESLILVGYLVPAATILLAAGAAAGAGYVEIEPALLGAVLGAAMGGALNFWLGVRFEPQVPRLWPFRQHPELLERNKRFVARHGGKSVLLGRFTKPLRPAVPAIAGMLGMERRRFMTYNLIGSLLWAPAYLYLGLLLASSAAFASTSPLQFSTLLLLITGLLWVSYVLIRRLHAARRSCDTGAD